MRFIPEKFAPIIMGLIVMTVMVCGIPIIVLLQRMDYSNPLFWTLWQGMVQSIAPYAVPLAMTTAILSRLLVGFFTIKPKAA